MLLPRRREVQSAHLSLAQSLSCRTGVGSDQIEHQEAAPCCHTHYLCSLTLE